MPTNGVVATSETTTSLTYTDLTTAGPSTTVTVTATGKALVTVTGQVMNSLGGDGCNMAFAVSGSTIVAASDAQALSYINNDGNQFNARSKQFSATYLVTGLTAGSNTFTAKYRAVTGGTCTFANRNIIAAGY